MYGSSLFGPEIIAFDSFCIHRTLETSSTRPLTRCVSSGLFPAVFFRAVKVSALIYAINVAAINALKYFNAINATLFTSGVRCPLTRNRRVCICNFIKVNTNMSHFLFLTLTLQQPPRLLHSPSSFTTDPPTNQPMRACYPTQPHPIGLELSHVPPRPVH